MEQQVRSFYTSVFLNMCPRRETDASQEMIIVNLAIMKKGIAMASKFGLTAMLRVCCREDHN